jgi:hypothetical protein
MTSSIHAVTFDCGDAGKLAAFWSQVLDRPVDPDAAPGFASIGLAGNAWPQVMFFQVPEEKTAKNRMHLDLLTSDLDVEVGRLEGLGARRGNEFDEGGVRWITLTDPEGNEFDVVADGS